MPAVANGSVLRTLQIQHQERIKRLYPRNGHKSTELDIDLRRKKPPLKLVEEKLPPLPPRPPPEPQDLSGFKRRAWERTGPAIIRATAIEFGFRSADLTGPTRTEKLCLARHVAMWLCRQWLPSTPSGKNHGNSYVNSLCAVGRLFHRDHTSVLHAIQRITKLLETNGDLYDEVVAIEAALNFSPTPLTP